MDDDGALCIVHPTSAVLACGLELPLGTFSDSMQQMCFLHNTHLVFDAEIAAAERGQPGEQPAVPTLLWKFWSDSHRFLVAAWAPSGDEARPSSWLAAPREAAAKAGADPAPSPQQLRTAFACRLLRLADALHRRASQMLLPNGDRLSIRLALHTGETVCGLVGSLPSAVRSMMIVGAACGVAEGLLSVASPGWVAVTSEAFDEAAVARLGITQEREQAVLQMGNLACGVWQLRLQSSAGDAATGRQQLRYSCPPASLLDQAFPWSKLWRNVAGCLAGVVLGVHALVLGGTQGEAAMHDGWLLFHLALQALAVLSMLDAQPWFLQYGSLLMGLCQLSSAAAYRHLLLLVAPSVGQGGGGQSLAAWMWRLSGAELFGLQALFCIPCRLRLLVHAVSLAMLLSVPLPDIIASRAGLLAAQLLASGVPLLLAWLQECRASPAA